jgi:hypothetical protein
MHQGPDSPPGRKKPISGFHFFAVTARPRRGIHPLRSRWIARSAAFLPEGNRRLHAIRQEQTAVYLCPLLYHRKTPPGDVTPRAHERHPAHRRCMSWGACSHQLPDLLQSRLLVAAPTVWIRFGRRVGSTTRTCTRRLVPHQAEKDVSVIASEAKHRHEYSRWQSPLNQKEKTSYNK